jgi:hypothetical protein
LRAWTAIVQPGGVFSPVCRTINVLPARKETLPLAPKPRERHMKPEFHEDYSTDKLDPLYETTVDFDLAEVERRLGEASDTVPDYAELAKVVHRLLKWVAAIDLGKPNAEAVVGRRFLAMAWVTNPELFEGSPSASKLAESLGIKRKADFWELTGEVSRILGITNRSQKHSWNRK